MLALGGSSLRDGPSHFNHKEPHRQSSTNLYSICIILNNQSNLERARQTLNRTGKSTKVVRIRILVKEKDLFQREESVGSGVVWLGRRTDTTFNHIAPHSDNLTAFRFSSSCLNLY